MVKIFGEGGGYCQPLESGIIADRHKTVIGVKGIGPGAGATFVAMNLAFEMAQQSGASGGVAFVEERVSTTGGYSAEKMLEVDPHYRRISAKGKTNIYKNVNWVFGSDNLRSTAGRFIIADDPESLEEPDLIVAVIDPLPSRIEAGLATYEELRKQQVPVIWIANKVNPQAGIREVERFLKMKFDYRVDMLAPEIFYKAEFACTQQYFIKKSQAIEMAAHDILERNN